MPRYLTTDSPTRVIQKKPMRKINLMALVMHVVRENGRAGMTLDDIIDAVEEDGVEFSSRNVASSRVCTSLAILSGCVPAGYDKNHEVWYRDELIRKQLKKDGGLYRYYFNPKGKVRVTSILRTAVGDKVTRAKLI